MNTYEMGLQNKRIHEISSKSNIGKVIKYTGKIFWGEFNRGRGENLGWGGNLGGEFLEKNENLQNVV